MSDHLNPDRPDQKEPTVENVDQGHKEPPREEPGAVVVAAGDGAGMDPAQEADQWTGRTSWKYFSGSLILWVVLAIVAIVGISWAAQGNDERMFFWQLKWDLIIIAAMGVFFLARMFLHILSHRYRLTSQRLFVERGILSQTVDQTELIRVDDVRLHKSLMDRILGLGTVEVMSTDATDENLRVIGIAAPEQVAEAIRTNMRHLRRKSLFVENL